MVRAPEWQSRVHSDFLLGLIIRISTTYPISDAKATARREILDLATEDGRRPSNPPQRDILDVVVGVLAQDQAGALAGGKNVLEQVLLVDGVPDLERLGARCIGGEQRVAVEVGCGIAKGDLAQPHEAGDIPVLEDRKSTRL